MPNWCLNTVSVRGRKTDVDEFRKFVASDESAFDFEKMMPTPSETMANGSEEWWYWRNTNWGTKWALDPRGIHVDEKRGGVVYRFETAWCPPTPIYLLLIGRFPQLKISWRFDEPDMGLRGNLNTDTPYDLAMEHASGCAKLALVGDRLDPNDKEVLAAFTRTLPQVVLSLIVEHRRQQELLSELGTK